jgi:hypothetical protein
VLAEAADSPLGGFPERAPDDTSVCGIVLVAIEAPETGDT